MTKLYYSIGEVAALFEVNTSLLRYWESEFEKLKPRKKKGGARMYTVQDIKLIERLYNLLKVEGYTIEGAQKVLNSKKISRSDKISELNQTIEKIESALQRLKRVRDSSLK
ncbi:MAG: MerR family transcriptional regulator [Saprospiraceae bacterium]|nr:MerR family transcriptional regulator [Saprospiraceae bacterium]